MAATCLTLGLAIAALGGGPAARAQDEMHGVDMLHPGAQFAPQMPSGLTPSGPLSAPAASSSGALPPSTTGTPALLEEHVPRQNATDRMIPGTPSIHTQEGRELNGCSGARTLPNQQIGSDKTFCGFGKN